MLNHNKKEYDQLFDEAICTVIEALTDHKDIDIKAFRIDSDNIITVEFICEGIEYSEFVVLEHVEFVLKKKEKELEREKKGNNNEN